MQDMKNFIRAPLQKLKKLNSGDKVELLTFKKDRKITIIKRDFNLYEVIEDGFEHKTFEGVRQEELEKLLNRLKRIEFPRSNKFALKVILMPDLNEQLMIE